MTVSRPTTADHHNGHEPPSAAAPLALHLDAEALRPFVQVVVAETVQQLERDRQKTVGGKLAYTEAEAAALLSLEQHQLRDERRRGRIKASVGPGRLILYTLPDLQEYLASRRWTENGPRHQET
jgi:hypothetical protein